MKQRTKEKLCICLCIILCLFLIGVWVENEVAGYSLSVPQEPDTVSTDTTCLNDIRFANFNDEDWLDNDYIRCLREYLDDYNGGEFEDEELEPYKEKIRGKFVIYNVELSQMGGLRILFLFIDHPEYLFSAYVYSTVDMEKKEIVGYSVLYINVIDKEFGMTKEEIIDSMKVHPELKLW